MPDKKKAILLRIAPEIAEALHRWARDELRSVNAQIEFILRDAVRKREGGRHVDAATLDEESAAFEAVRPWLEQLVGQLRSAGLTDWAQRLEGAIAFGATPADMLANVRATLEEMVEQVPGLPVELKQTALGLVRGLEEHGFRRPGPSS